MVHLASFPVRDNRVECLFELKVNVVKGGMPLLWTNLVAWIHETQRLRKLMGSEDLASMAPRV
jgi:hypothetical protein